LRVLATTVITPRHASYQNKTLEWKEVGFKVELYNSRLTEFNAFYDANGSDINMTLHLIELTDANPAVK